VDDRPEIFAPQALLPEQYFDRFASRGPDAPYKRLMIAVLMDAILQLRSRDAQDVIQAESWVGDAETTDDGRAQNRRVELRIVEH